MSSSDQNVEKQRKELDRQKLALDRETTKAVDNEKRAITLKRELDDFKQKSKKQKVNQNDVRLQRALAEVNFITLYYHWDL